MSCFRSDQILREKEVVEAYVLHYHVLDCGFESQQKIIIYNLNLEKNKINLNQKKF